MKNPLGLFAAISGWIAGAKAHHGLFESRTAADGAHNYMALNRARKRGKFKASIHRKR